MNQFRRPLVAALLAFLAGLAYSLRFAPSPIHGPIVGVLALTFLGANAMGLVRLRPARERLALLALFLSSGMISGGLARVDSELDCRASLTDGMQLEIQGRIGAAHRPRSTGSNPPLLPLLGGSVTQVPGCGGEFRVRLPPDENALLPGSAVLLRGEWRSFARPVTPSAWPRNPLFRGFLRADTLLIPDPSSADPISPWLGLRARADRAFSRLFPEHQSFVEALLLGRREYVDPAVTERFTTSGLSHLLAISGAHVGLFAGALLLLGGAARLSRRVTILLTLVTTWLYLLVIGAPASALRAGCMISIVLCAYLLQRPSAAGPIMAMAAFVILTLRPLALLEPGFQLSFLGVLGILALKAPLLSIAPDDVPQKGLIRWAVDAMVIGVAAFVATAPVVAHHFGIIAPISVLAGLPAVPLMSLALIGSGAAVALEPVLPAVAFLIADGAALALDLLDATAGLAAAVPFGHATVPKPPWWSWGAALMIAVFVTRIGLFHTRRIRVAAASSAAAIVLVVWPIGVRAATDGLEIHFIDVGQGDGIAIRTPRARWVLIDAGPASADYDAGERRILPFLRDQGARRLEVLVLTHPDLDHIGGAAAILQRMRVDFVFEPGAAVGKEPYLDMIRTIEASGTDWRAVRQGRTMELDGVRFEFLWPVSETVDATVDANQISAVVRMTYGAFSMLLTGDAGAEVESELVSRYGAALESRILKLGHHGSSTSSSGPFLDVVAPELAVVSAGRRNRYGHPSAEVLAAVESREIPLARTDREGTISLMVEAGGNTWRREEW